jgi:putative SOS response-associated peptidase YedK
VGKKTSIPYRFVLKSQAVFSFPGLWEEFEDTDGSLIQTFAIITLPPDEIGATLPDRMPVILNAQAEKIWLGKDSPEHALLNVLSAQNSEMNYYPVSPRISQKDIDVPSLILPTPPSDQHGNLTLFD